MNENTRTDLAQEDDAMPWHLSNRADPRGARLADSHYSRKTPGAAQFTPPGRCVVLRTTMPCGCPPGRIRSTSNTPGAARGHVRSSATSRRRCRARSLPRPSLLHAGSGESHLPSAW